MTDRLRQPGVPGAGLRLVACSVLGRELRALVDRHPDWPRPTLLDSLLHLWPERLDAAIAEVCPARLPAAAPLVLVYGDCCPGLTDRVREGSVVRTVAANCCELLLGANRYRALRREGAFFLLPEWTRRWREVLPQALGLPEPLARELFAETHRKLVYLDSGCEPVSEEALAEVGAYTGLPLERVAVDLASLEAAVTAALAAALAAAGRARRGTAAPACGARSAP